MAPLHSRCRIVEYGRQFEMDALVQLDPRQAATGVCDCGAHAPLPIEGLVRQPHRRLIRPREGGDAAKALGDSMLTDSGIAPTACNIRCRRGAADTRAAMDKERCGVFPGTEEGQQFLDVFG